MEAAIDSASELQLPDSDVVAFNDLNQLRSPQNSDAGASASAGGGARYKLMSPAKLPISRSPCITIPPGLSPTSFLESPVLLSNMKVPAGFSNHVINEQSRQIDGPGIVQSYASSTLVKTETAVPSNKSSLSSTIQMVSSGTSAPVEVDPDKLNQKGNAAPGLRSSLVDGRGNTLPVAAERISDDGYNWRKYGQKHVKGCEFPRSYYKCTHPNCEVKKLFERSHDGQITEIIYKGKHDHPKPQPSRRYSASTMMSIQEERTDKALSAGQDDKASNMHAQVPHTTEPNSNPDLSPVPADSPDGVGLLSNRVNDEVDDDDDPFSKRSKMDIGNADITPIVKPIREPRVVVQTQSEVDILDDGYRWRKYGQKVVRGNPNPRSYYKCTNVGCPVRKHVERASHDPKAVITTYEGKHNHDVPTARSTSHDTAGPTVAAGGQTRIRPEESDTVSLDLGMGIRSAAENTPNRQGRMLLSEFGNSQTHSSNTSLNFVHNTRAPAYFSVLHNGSNPYVSRENLSDGPSLNHSSYPCPPNMGRILTGP
ncbi:probable WRKY transcription factor 20 isoform X2 [Prosopis cineraria]|uniref:probable WRKY transcription factor 20 isoform X2 n=1 Tax=Prosopis cineraria TaxID=364024 RepID=UPI002410902D|nr:probable WRKY transcription factor 20 isoform X2 [Prosopis cineraria]